MAMPIAKVSPARTSSRRRPPSTASAIPMIGDRNGAISMAPMITAAESVISPNVAIAPERAVSSRNPGVSRVARRTSATDRRCHQEVCLPRSRLVPGVGPGPTLPGRVDRARSGLAPGIVSDAALP